MAALSVLVLAAAEIVAMPAFMAGCWEQRRANGSWTEECWTAPRGGLMIGSGRSGKGDTVRAWEWMRIERDASGKLTFFGSPGGAPAVVFTAIAVDPNGVTFVNPAHDFPQRIRYTRSTEGLDAEASLADGSQPSRWSYRQSGAPAK
jgi:hypothetical protein